MGWYKTASEEATDEMLDWYEERTDKHIERVQKYCKKIHNYDEGRFGDLIERGKIHDQSKLSNPERDPYIFITWQYKCKDDGVDFEISSEMEEEMNQATQHHVKHNLHHPEAHSDKETDLINREDRDKPPDEMIDATKMTELDVTEMVCDWCAMSEEKGNSPKEWADKNVNIRWKFTDKQKDLIYELIEAVF